MSEDEGRPYLEPYIKSYQQADQERAEWLRDLFLAVFGHPQRMTDRVAPPTPARGDGGGDGVGEGE